MAQWVKGLDLCTWQPEFRSQSPGQKKSMLCAYTAMYGNSHAFKAAEWKLDLDIEACLPNYLKG